MLFWPKANLSMIGDNILKKITTATIRNMKNKEPITVLTAYDYPTAKACDEAGIEVILVGDSLGMVVLGYDSTIPVTIEDMIHHGKAVVRGVKRSLVVIDMPFMSYHISLADTLANAAKIMQLTGAASVKLEGGSEISETVRVLTSSGIPVMGHIGLLPQSVHQYGGYMVQGKDIEAAKKLLLDAKELEAAGAYAIVLECVPFELAKSITEQINIPTIGIGAGNNCDGQVLVIHDMLGIQGNVSPKFVKQYNSLSTEIQNSLQQYIHEVKNRLFPLKEHSFDMTQEVLNQLYGRNES
ncbi:3-methyl-2-oxobutanoate hydroxymethyltransferase [Desulfuribacillus stibiiarsenatis]|uniref:3-methyl-2-oxobutanoate hydroxymethyltransferase n=1 Tax=Desulfuribacillus stibiiarsenatis TaxID=1390249 RepID=UPI000AA63C34|nr:3-methyl-2-oxobutanoate hydroxymethyltransferase [Desulfuribacillus stibiiarsenatis]